MPVPSWSFTPGAPLYLEMLWTPHPKVFLAYHLGQFYIINNLCHFLLKAFFCSRDPNLSWHV